MIEGIARRTVTSDRLDICVSVRNLSSTTTLNDVQVVTEWVRPSGAAGTPTPRVRPLQDEFSGAVTADIAPEDAAHFVLCSVSDDDEGIHESMHVAPHRDGSSIKLPLGGFKLQVKATARDHRPIRDAYEIKATKAWVNFKSSPEHIVTKMGF